MLYHALVMWLAVSFFGVSNLAVAEEAKKAQDGKRDTPEYFAIIGDVTISKDEFAAYLRAGMRQRFYHGNVPENELKAFIKESGDEMINRVLLVKEAKRRKIVADPKQIEKQLAEAEQRYKDDKYYQENKKTILPVLRKDIEEDLLVEVLKQQVMKVSDPKPKEVKEFYEANKDLFTTPAKDHVLMILLKVDPSSPSSVWRETEKKASDILAKIRAKEDFKEMARVHSGDPSAMNGGDLGYLHRGMLGDVAQQVIDLLQPGDVSEPAMLLEGVALFKLVERSKAELNPFEAVQERATGLLKRKRADDAWNTLTPKLREKTKIVVNERLLEIN
ncbi:MAG: peptidylprolyl isomerase [Pseudomonadota bacterium]